MEKPELNVYISAEATDEEKLTVINAFEERFEVIAHKGELRFSENLLPLVITIAVGVASNAFWDLLKSAVNKFRKQSSSKINRETVIKIRKSQKDFIITKDTLFVREIQEDRQYQSVDELFDELEND
jgi:hypothetical protein